MVIIQVDRLKEEGFRLYMKKLQLKKLYVPAFSIVAVVLILLVLISISTYRNLNRDKARALEFIHRQGLALIRTMEAGVRVGINHSKIQNGHEVIERLIRETEKDEEIAYIYMLDEQGVIISHSDAPKQGRPADQAPLFIDEGQVQSRVRELSDGSKAYELAKCFLPFHLSNARFKCNNIIVLALKMAAFEEARHTDFHHALIMAGIVVALGSGVLFFVFVIQNYYLAQGTLKETQDYTRQVVASMANGLLSVNQEGEVVSYNLLALELLGLKEPEIRGTDLKKFIDFEASGISETLSQCSSVLEKEIHHRKKSGEEVPLALSVSPIKDENNKCKAAVIVLRDLREIKRLESKVKRSENLAVIGKLAAGVAHEVRNPLGSVRGFAQFLSHALKDRPQERKYAETMVKELDRIDRVVTDLLIFARPLEPQLAPVDINELVEHILRLVHADARNRGIEIHQDISPDLGKLPLDENQMTQALLNLILNAIQAVESGGDIEVGADLHAHGTRLNIWVKSDGPGIPPEQREKIFDPFFTTKKKGTGLGLSIVHKIVENHGGEIMLESPLPGKNHGCRFNISIPIDVDKINFQKS
jgi:two-component system sensor histidine kinase HydH